jgi:hypothetical protein
MFHCSSYPRRRSEELCSWSVVSKVRPDRRPVGIRMIHAHVVHARLHAMFRYYIQIILSVIVYSSVEHCIYFV